MASPGQAKKCLLEGPNGTDLNSLPRFPGNSWFLSTTWQGKKKILAGAVESVWVEGI